MATRKISEAYRKMQLARSNLIMENQAFFGQLAFKLELVEDPSCDTCYTNGLVIGFNPEYIMARSLDETIALVCEEVMHCFPAGTQVAGDDKPIEQFAVGDEVLGRGGMKCRVVERHVHNYRGKLYTLKARGLLPIEMTSEHPVLVSQPRWSHTPRPEQRGIRVWSKPEWKTACTVTIDDWVFVPQIAGSDDLTKLEFTFDNAWSVKPQIRDGVVLDEEIAEFLGWYVAEGWATITANQIQIGLALAEKERPVAERLASMIQRRMGYSSSIQKAQGESIDLIFSSAPLGRFLREHCGAGAHHKKIPKFILYHRDPTLLRAFLKGYVSGDGFVNKMIGFATVSRTLAMQVQLGFARLGVLVGLCVRDPKVTIIQGQVANGGIIYIGYSRNQKTFDLLGVERRTPRPTNYFGQLEGHLLTPIQEVQEREFEGEVFNFETQDHTYTAGNIVTHNCANGHSWRRDARDPREWNVSCDYSILGIIKDAGMKIPADSCYDPKYDGKSAEAVYSEIHREPPPSQQKPQPQPGGGSGSGQPGDDGDEDENGSSVDPVDKPQKQPPRKPFSGGEVRDLPAKEDKAAIENDWKIAVIQAATAAQSQGKLPAGIEQLLESIKHPQVDYKAVTRKWLQQLDTSDFSWERPNRRWLASGLYLPALRSDAMPPMAVYWDSSGSRDTADARAECAGELLEIFKELKPERLYVVYADAEVQRVDVFERGDPIEFHPKGGGGTDFRPPLAYFEENEIEIAGLIGITDLEGTFPDESPSFPVLWCATERHPVPFGDVVYIGGK